MDTQITAGRLALFFAAATAHPGLHCGAHGGWLSMHKHAPRPQVVSAAGSLHCAPLNFVPSPSPCVVRRAARPHLQPRPLPDEWGGHPTLNTAPCSSRACRLTHTAQPPKPCTHPWVCDTYSSRYAAPRTSRCAHPPLKTSTLDCTTLFAQLPAGRCLRRQDLPSWLHPPVLAQQPLHHLACLLARFLMAQAQGSGTQ